MPFAGHAPLASVETLQQLWCITDGSAVNGRVVDGNAPLGHHSPQSMRSPA
jgi:hypothetical protein